MSDQTEERCKQHVFPSGLGSGHQCSRKAKRDGYCTQHHPDAVVKRAFEAEKRYEEYERNEPVIKLLQAWDRIKKLKAEKADLLKVCQDVVREAGPMDEDNPYDTFIRWEEFQAMKKAIAKATGKK